MSESEALALDRYTVISVDDEGFRSEETISAPFEPPILEDFEPSWEVRDGLTSFAWVMGEGEFSLSALAEAEFPEGARDYRIRYLAGDDDPTATKGYVTSITLGPDQWPPRMGASRNGNEQGIAGIIFRKA